ncbi:MAG: hypothetical protein J6T03_03465 [Bacteroidales bacterium]|nr:hypothetical protein [Bacteroidales bacterium]
MGIMLLPVQTVYSQPALDFGSGGIDPVIGIGHAGYPYSKPHISCGIEKRC